MRFLRKNRVRKTLLVISDIHLGAGNYVNNQRNFLEDFHYDKEMVEILEYFSTGDYVNREVELVINGDLFDLLAVPFVPYFDDEFWSEEAALEKLKMIMDAHPEVMQALNDFLLRKKKNIVFVIGNHDAEFVFPSLQKYFNYYFDEKARRDFEIRIPSDGEYRPEPDVVLMHGHEYEPAHLFDPDRSILEDRDGRKYFIPPWGSYYVTKVLNKFKEQRNHVNAVRPIHKFVINGFIYDPLYTVRFGLANFFYFVMVRFIYFFKLKNGFKETFQSALNELELFQDYETLTEDYFEQNPEVKALIVGHTHDPKIRTFSNGKIFINTGTWTDMHYLDFDRQDMGRLLTFAQLDFFAKADTEQEAIFRINLNYWKGFNNLPFEEV